MMPRVRACVRLSILLLLALAPARGAHAEAPEAPAKPHAEAPTAAIIVLAGEDSGFPLSETYARARAVIEANTALNVAPFDFLSIDERTDAIRRCAGDAACFADALRATSGGASVSFLLLISINRAGESSLLSFLLVDVEARRQLGVSANEMQFGISLGGAMEAELPKVFPATVWGQVSSVDVRTDPPGAEVSIAGRSCVSPCVLNRLAPGRQEVVIKKEGFDPWSGAVTLTARTPAQLSQKLNEQEHSLVSNPILWGIVGAVAVAGGVAAYFALRTTDRTVNICTADPGSGPCH